MTTRSNTRKVVKVNEVRLPDCFSFYDERDPSCRKCKARDNCIEKLEATRPSCYGELFDDSHVECTACLVASQCTEKQEGFEMTRKKVKIRRRTAVAPVPEPEPEVVEDEIEDEDYSEWKVAELREELKDRDLDATGRKSVLVERLQADDAGELDDEPEPEPVKKATRRRTRKAKPAPAPEPEDDEEEDVPVVATLDEVFALLENGQTISVTRLAKNKYQFAPGGAAVAAGPRRAGLRGAAFDREAFSEEYQAFMFEDAGNGKAWKDMTPEERYEMADDVKATWDEHENEKTDWMRMGLAVRKVLGVEKWKPEYASRAARKALKEGL